MKLEDLKRIREEAEKKLKLRGEEVKTVIVVGMGTSGIAAGARETLGVFLEEIEKRGLNDVIVKQSGEKGYSSYEPIVEVREKGKKAVVYGKVTPQVARLIVSNHLVNGNILDEYVVEVEE